MRKFTFYTLLVLLALLDTSITVSLTFLGTRYYDLQQVRLQQLGDGEALAKLAGKLDLIVKKLDNESTCSVTLYEATSRLPEVQNESPRDHSRK